MSDADPADAESAGRAARPSTADARVALRRGRVMGRWKRIGYVVAGATCLVIGVIGGFVPILQGWMFIGLGIAFLAPVFPPARRAMVWAFRRWPRLRRAVPRRFRRAGRTFEGADESDESDESDRSDEEAPPS